MLNLKKNNNLYNNLICGWILQAVTAFIGLVLPKMILEHYGSVLNGLISSVTQFISYLSLVEFGIYNASLVALYKPLAENNVDELNGVMSAINKYFVQIAKLFSFFFLFVLILYPRCVRNEVSEILVIKTLIAVGLYNFLNYLLVAKYKVLLQADNRVFIVYLVHILGLILQYVLNVIVITLNLEIYYTKVIIILTTVIEFLFLRKYCLKKYSFIDLKTIPLEGKIKQRGDIILHQVAGLIVNNTDMVLLTMFTNLSEVSVYTIYSMIYILITGIGDIVVNSTISPLGKLLATNKKKQALDYYDKYENYFQLLNFSITLCMAILILPFIKMYTSNIKDANYCRMDVGILFSIMALTKIIRLPIHSVVNAKGHFKQTRNQAVLEAIINIIISLILVIKIGLPGVLIGTIISNIYRVVHLWVYCYRCIMPFNLKRSVYRVVVNCLVSLGILYGAKEINLFYINLDSLMKFVILGLIILLVIIVMLVLVNYISEGFYEKLYK